MKDILTTLFISLCAVFAGCSHDDADNLAGGETGGGRKLGENIIEFKVQRDAKYNYDADWNVYSEKTPVAWVDWGDGNKEDGQWRSDIAGYVFGYKYNDDNVHTVKFYSTNPFYLSMEGNFTDLKMGYMPNLAHFYIRPVPNGKTYHFSRLSGTFDLGECPFLERLTIYGTKFNLTNINVSGCTKFGSIDLDESCDLSADELNAIFRVLPEVKESHILYISFHPGASTCDKSIAQRKGWKVLGESR